MLLAETNETRRIVNQMVEPEPVAEKARRSRYFVQHQQEGLQLMSDEEEQQLLSDTATILKMDPPWDATEDALHAAERALFAITKAVHHYKWHRQVLGDFWMARAVLVLKPYDAA